MEKHVHGGNIYEYDGCLDFSANLNPLGLPECVRSAVIESLQEASRYPQVGYAPLKEAIAEYEQVEPWQVTCGNGAAEVIYTLCRAAKPRQALLLAPTFAEYEQALAAVDCQIISYPLHEEEGFVLSHAFLDAITDGIDLIFLCNPNNPTGMLLSREFLLEVLACCEKSGSLLVVDECFLDFVKEPERYTLLEELKRTGHLFLLKAFTKRYAMAGIRLGYGLCGNRRLLEEMERMVQPWNVSVMAQAAGIAALQATEYVERGRDIVFQEAGYLKEALGKLGFRLYDSQANYIFFKGPEDLFERAVKEGILLRDCSNYRGLKKGFFRIAIKNHEENRILISKLEQILKD